MLLNRRPDIERFLERPTAGFRAALIHGRDRQVVRERADTLAKAINPNKDDPFDIALLTEGDLSDPARLEDELQALSLAGGRRLIRLRFTGERGMEAKPFQESLIAHGEGAFNPDAFLVVEAPALDGRSALRRAAEKAPGVAVIPCYDDEAGDTARLLREALAKERISLTNEALEMVVSRLPHERGVARQEVERLTLFIGPGRHTPVQAAELEAFLGVEPEASLLDAAQDAFGGRAGPAQAHLRRAAAEGEGGPAAVRALGVHLARLRRIQILTANGAGLTEAAKAAGVFWKNEREVLRQARAWALPHLDELTADLLAADRGTKTTGAPDRLIAERLAMTIAAKARRLGL